jgi:hypothetical protein
MKSPLIGFGVAVFHGCFLACADAAPVGSTEQLPVDRFDEYPAGEFPPHPWKSAAAPVDGVEAVLSPEAESPFPNNKVTGKGLALSDESAGAGKGQGIVCEFLPPPPGEVYLGYDFRLIKGEDGEGLDLECRLTNAAGNGLVISMSKKDGLRFKDAEGRWHRIMALTFDMWYHLGVTISSDHQARVSLFTQRSKSKPVGLGKVSFRTPAVSDFTQLRFVSSGEDTQTGGWQVDNISIAGRVDASRADWWPFRRASEEELRASKRKVFAYFYPIYSSGASSEDPGLSWFALTTLNASTEVDPRRKEAGTKLFYHPLLRPPLEAGLSREEQLVLGREEEIRLARQMGLDGFVVDFFSYPADTGGQKYFDQVSFATLQAAERVDPGFKIIPAVYSGGDDMDPIKYAQAPVFRIASESPAVMRTADGKMLISMWLTERHSAEWWKTVLAELERLGRPAALVTQFNSMNKLEEFAPLVAGMSHWGPRTPRKTGWIAAARKWTPLVVAPVAPHDIRSRGSIFWEAQNFDTLRRTWQAAIEEGADWVFINTWSDYSEQAMAPSTAIGFAPYDLSAYYLQWFKMGEPPAITRDVLYYSYRRHHSSLEPAHGRKWKVVAEGENREVRDEIELLAFLKEPGQLQIRIGDDVFTKDAPQGVTSFKVPLPRGKAFTPEFALVREGRTILLEAGRHAVLDRIEYPNMLYHSGVIAAEKK